MPIKPQTKWIIVERKQKSSLIENISHRHQVVVKEIYSQQGPRYFCDTTTNDKYDYSMNNESFNTELEAIKWVSNFFKGEKKALFESIRTIDEFNKKYPEYSI